MAYGDWKGVGMRIPGGKGSIQRQTDMDKFREGYDRIFRKNKNREIDDELDRAEQEAALLEDYNDEDSRRTNTTT